MRYFTGFVLCLLLTAAAYVLVVGGSTGPIVLVTLGVLALVQMLVQLVFFLHLGEEASPRYKIVTFALMAGVLFIIVAGSLWIMANLDYNMMHMTPEEKDNYMITNFDKGF